jgi:hypothetical protein
MIKIRVYFYLFFKKLNKRLEKRQLNVHLLYALMHDIENISFSFCHRFILDLYTNDSSQTDVSSLNDSNCLTLKIVEMSNYYMKTIENVIGLNTEKNFTAAEVFLL